MVTLSYIHLLSVKSEDKDTQVVFFIQTFPLKIIFSPTVRVIMVRITMSNWLSGCIDICLHLKNDPDVGANKGRNSRRRQQFIFCIFLVQNFLLFVIIM